MKKKGKKGDVDPKDLPQSEVFTRKEIFQHPQPADRGIPLSPRNPKQHSPTADNSKEENKTSKENGLNEEKSRGDAGAFEGFEDQARGNK